MRLTSRLIPAMVVALACAEADTPEDGAVRGTGGRHGPVTYSARVVVRADGRSGPLVASTEVTYTNTGSQPTELMLPAGCFVALRLTQADGDRGWDQERWRAIAVEQAGFALACADTARRVRLAPGARATFTSADSPMVIDILGDSLPGGEYDVVASVLPPQGAPGGRVTLPAGRITLSGR